MIMNKSPIKEKKELVREYIRNNPKCTYRDIRKNTKIKVERVYKNMKEAYKDAGIELSKNLIKRNRKEQTKEVVNFIKKNPTCTVLEIQNSVRVSVPRLFGSIIDAYKLANVKYPKKEVTSGVVNYSIIKRSKEFEIKMIERLKNIGDVKTKIRTKSGVVDCLFNYKNKNFVVEIKDFRARNNITMSQIKQLVKYMRSLNYEYGLIICPKKSLPKRKNGRKVYIDNFKIKIISEDELRGRSITAV